jgi:hypothetical protein
LLNRQPGHDIPIKSPIGSMPWLASKSHWSLLPPHLVMGGTIFRSLQHGRIQMFVGINHSLHLAMPFTEHLPELALKNWNVGSNRLCCVESCRQEQSTFHGELAHVTKML